MPSRTARRPKRVAAYEPVDGAYAALLKQPRILLALLAGCACGALLFFAGGAAAGGAAFLSSAPPSAPPHAPPSPPPGPAPSPPPPSPSPPPPPPPSSLPAPPPPPPPSPAPSPPPSLSPSPPPLTAEQRVELLNDRFASGGPSNNLESAGILVRQLDGLNDVNKPWLPCRHTGNGDSSWCAEMADRWATSLVNPGARNLY